jgi:uridine phosphorylase
MRKFEASELILNPDGSIYHLKVKPGEVADTIIVVGDPKRVENVSKYFDKIEFQVQNRELVTHTGYFNGKRISAISTGMGPDNIDIVISELDAVFNIDFDRRELKDNITSLNVVRLGTSGALQTDIPVDSFVLSTHGLGIDGLLHFYKDEKGIYDEELTKAFIEQTNWPEEMARPYIVKGSETLAARLGEGMYSGITATAGGFFGPQGRELRMKLAYPELIDRMEAFRHNGFRISNFEMETSALYGLGALMGHQMCTICVAIANRPAKTYSNDYKPFVDQLIRTVLERLTA